MHRILLATIVALSASACAGPSVRDVLIPTFGYHPTAVGLVTIVDSPSDIRTCRRLDVVGPPVVTGPLFDIPLQAMLERTVALSGTHLYLQRLTEDWSHVRGIAYFCEGFREREQVVVRARG